MAKVKLGSIVTNISGAIGGSVFYTGKDGTVCRIAVMAKNKNTIAVARPKLYFSLTAQRWRGLTETQRIAWRAAALNFTVTDRVGNAMVLSGFQYFMRSAINVLDFNNTMQTTPPFPQPFAGFQILSAVYSNTASSLVTTLQVIGSISGQAFSLEMSKPYSAGVTAAPNKFRPILSGNQAAVQANAFTAYRNIYGYVPVGSRIFVRVGLHFTALGFASQRVISSSIVV